MRKHIILILLIIYQTAFSQEKMELENWDRKYFKKPLFEPFIFLVIYGEFDVDFNIPQHKYRIAGIPDGIDLMGYGPDAHPEVPGSFLEGYLWETLKETDPSFADQVQQAPECFVIRGSVPDSDNLNYLRDIIGLTAYLLDHGGIAVYDPQMFTWWKKSDWLTQIFEPKAAVPRKHVIILYSEEENGTKWIHTRGMRLFGRPDLSIHNVPEEYETAVLDMLNRFIDLQALGGIIEDNQPIRMKSLPEGMWCKNEGSFEDPDFNNKHVDIYWK